MLKSGFRLQDFENERDRAGFKFRIFVNDQGDLSRPKDTAQVHITLNDINDNPPKFEKHSIRVQVKLSLMNLINISLVKLNNNTMVVV